MKKVVLAVITLTAITACKIGSRRSSEDGNSGSGLASINVGVSKTKLAGFRNKDVSEADFANILKNMGISLKVVKTDGTKCAEVKDTLTKAYDANLEAFTLSDLKLTPDCTYSFDMSLVQFPVAAGSQVYFSTGKPTVQKIALNKEKDKDGKETGKVLPTKVTISLCLSPTATKVFDASQVGTCVASDNKDGTDVKIDTDFEKAKNDLSAKIDLVLTKVSSNKDAVTSLTKIQQISSFSVSNAQLDGSACHDLITEVDSIDSTKDSIIAGAVKDPTEVVKTELPNIISAGRKLIADKCQGAG